MEDHLVRVVSNEGNVIGRAAVTTGLVDEARRIHGTSPTASAALGRALTGALLMGALLKSGQRLALKFEGNGPLRKIIVEVDSEGAARGFVAVPEVFVPSKGNKLDVGAALGKEGTLTVMKDLGLKEPYRGIVQLRTGEIGDDIAHYFAESEQIPSAVGLGVFVEPDGKVSLAGGFLIQTLPPADERMAGRLIANIGDLSSVTEILRRGQPPEDLLAAIFSGIPYRLLRKQELFLRCSCSRDRAEQALIALGSEELAKLMAEQEETAITCEYCRTVYRFTRGDLEAIRRGIDLPS